MLASSDSSAADERSQLTKDQNDCFYNLCEKSTYCGGNVICGQFKSRRNRIFCTFLVLMLVSLFFAVIVPLVLYSMADDSINEEVVIDSTSAVNYESWQSNAYGSGFDDIKVSYDLYYFDVQNVEGVLSGEKPVVVEVGPYSFDEYFVKFDIEWSDGGDTVSYNTQKYYIPNLERTGPGLSMDDEITLPYATVVGFQYLLGELPPQFPPMVDAFLIGKLDAKYAVLQQNLTDIYNAIPPGPLYNNLRKQIKMTNDTMNMLFQRMETFILESNTADLLLKTLMCPLQSGVSPFFKVKPAEAWFGWLNDPLLAEVTPIINNLNAKLPPEAHVGWTTAVPGAATNWTSIEETRRRRNPDVFKTGKKNKNQVAQYVQFNGMNSNKYHVCTNPAASQNASLYIEGEQFPACELWNNDWTEEEAAAKGYVVPWATEDANRIKGTDANMYGRPVRSEKLQVFVSDIYRTVFIEHQKDVDWNGVTLRRYGIQLKDMLNATANPENAQYYNFAPSGMENTTSAAGIPVFVSFPHFYLADERLVAAVTGLNPNTAAHETYIDIEPQTGLLARADKKLQVNYQLDSKKFPATQADSLSIAHGICANLTEVEEQISKLPNPPELPELSCENALVDGLLTCWSLPSEWQFPGESIFMPYGWASEQMTLPDSAADDLNNSLFLIDDLAVAIRFWCLIIAGLCFAVLAAMVVSDYYSAQDMRKDYVERVKAAGGGEQTAEPLMGKVLSSAPPTPSDKFSSFSA